MWQRRESISRIAEFKNNTLQLSRLMSAGPDGQPLADELSKRLIEQFVERVARDFPHHSPRFPGSLLGVAPRLSLSLDGTCPNFLVQSPLRWVPVSDSLGIRL